DKKNKFTCELCGDQFSRQIALTRHLNTSHNNNNNDEKSKQCVTCGITFSTLKEWKSHSTLCCNNINSSDGDTLEHICEQCDERFTTVTHLRYHKRTAHQRIRTYDCAECGQHFLRLNSFKYHCCIEKKPTSIKTDDSLASSTSNEVTTTLHSSNNTTIIVTTTANQQSTTTSTLPPPISDIPTSNSLSSSSSSNNSCFTAIAILSALVSSLTSVAVPAATGALTPNSLKSNDDNVINTTTSNCGEFGFDFILCPT
ncbi:unnamed protein product, partial [Schistosoma turkestanicum]